MGLLNGGILGDFRLRPAIACPAEEIKLVVFTGGHRHASIASQAAALALLSIGTRLRDESVPIESNIRLSQPAGHDLDQVVDARSDRSGRAP
jgi:hypothetical protein